MGFTVMVRDGERRKQVSQGVKITRRWCDWTMIGRPHSPAADPTYMMPILSAATFLLSIELAGYGSIHSPHGQLSRLD